MYYTVTRHLVKYEMTLALGKIYRDTTLQEYKKCSTTRKMSLYIEQVCLLDIRHRGASVSTRYQTAWSKCLLDIRQHGASVY